MRAFTTLLVVVSAKSRRQCTDATRVRVQCCGRRRNCLHWQFTSRTFQELGFATYVVPRGKQQRGEIHALVSCPHDLERHDGCTRAPRNVRECLRLNWYTLLSTRSFSRQAESLNESQDGRLILATHTCHCSAAGATTFDCHRSGLP
jgi:hypothetical protein